MDALLSGPSRNGRTERTTESPIDRERRIFSNAWASAAEALSLVPTEEERLHPAKGCDCSDCREERELSSMEQIHPHGRDLAAAIFSNDYHE